DLWINEEALLGHTAHRLYDAEEEVNLGRLYDNAKRQYVPGTWRHVWVGRHDFKVMVME
ncbi:MAG: hypothetical protein HY318_03620, partial [Armatimonadetes bacterium]|nr:hypothetical protein [Armatimonadota bacterium]